jgi:hypothetical protein
VDEVGYLTYGDDAANVLFHVVNDRHLRRRPMIFTTNKAPFTLWGDVLHDRDLAEAIVDRTLESGQLLVLDGPSYRTRHLPPEAGLDTNSKPARIPGKHRPEFPEPTNRSAVSSNRPHIERRASPVQVVRWQETAIGGLSLLLRAIFADLSRPAQTTP